MDYTILILALGFLRESAGGYPGVAGADLPHADTAWEGAKGVD